MPRSEHGISRRNISDEALKVLYRLRALGFKAYLVGGGVRDLYLGRTPKDFDIATDARPSRLKKIFRNCRIIGRRFRIAHVFFPGDKIIEVATFRRGEVRSIERNSKVILLDNEYGSPEEDAKRRDLTINGLFYDIDDFSIIDYVGGVEDLKHRVVRTIKDPDESFQEDPVRMIRALRHAARTDFEIEPATADSIMHNRLEIRKANPSRLMEEVFKDLRSGAADKFFRGFTDRHLMETLLPTLSLQLEEYGEAHPLHRRLQMLDRLAKEERVVSNPLLLTCLLHTVFVPHPETWDGESPYPRGIWRILQVGTREASEYMRLSKRDLERVYQVILAWPRIMRSLREGRLPASYQTKSYLASALDYVAIDIASRGDDTSLVERWRATYAPDGDRERPRRRMRTFRHRRRRGGRGGEGRRQQQPQQQQRPEARPAADEGAPPRRKKKRKPSRNRRKRGGRDTRGAS